MFDEPQRITLGDESVQNLSDHVKNEQEEADYLLNLIAEIIVEIIISKKHECNRIY